MQLDNVDCENGKQIVLSNVHWSSVGRGLMLYTLFDIHIVKIQFNV